DPHEVWAGMAGHVVTQAQGAQGVFEVLAGQERTNTEEVRPRGQPHGCQPRRVFRVALGAPEPGIDRAVDDLDLSPRDIQVGDQLASRRPTHRDYLLRPEEMTRIEPHSAL